MDTLPKLRSFHGSLARAIWLFCAFDLAAQEHFGFTEAHEFLEQHCLACHQGAAAPVGFQIDALLGESSFRERPEAWRKIAERVESREMPPRGSRRPATGARVAFVDWIDRSWREHACEAGPTTARFPVRRLNRDEYGATVRDLFDIQIDVSERFPVDGAGGEGFDNAAETSFISPLLAEKYLETATHVVDVASKEFKSRTRIFVSRPGEGVSEQTAARRILAEFLPRAFRRPVRADEIESYARLFRRVRRKGLDFESAIFAAVRSALVSPSYLFHVVPEPAAAGSRQYALASRFSYFLWGSAPDELLLDLAAAGRLSDPQVLERLVPRMLRDQRALEFFTRFTEQWLRTRELEGAHGPDPVLFPDYHTDAELRGDIRLQPVFFVREVFRGNRSLLEFLDSGATILTQGLIDHLGLPMKKKQDSKNPNWMDLPEGSGRGGLLGMPAIAAVASHPHRTSPVLRGAWILDAILGNPPPPPPPDVPELEEAAPGAPPKSLREMLAQHSREPSCANCHARIDPFGFALENYDVVGRWREEEGGVPVDATAELLDGTQLAGPEDLKQALFDRKRQFLRNLTRRMLGYALGRGLTSADPCAVETIVQDVERQQYSAWALLRGVVTSEPFLGHSSRVAETEVN